MLNTVVNDSYFPCLREFVKGQSILVGLVDLYGGEGLSHE